MQTPINTAERNSAFWKFLFFFVLTVAMIVTAIFFNTKLPFVENALLKEKAENANAQSLAQEKFNKSINEVKVLLDSMDKPQAQLNFINDNISNKLTNLNNIYIVDNSVQAGLDKTIISTLQSFSTLKSSTTMSADIQKEIAELKSSKINLQAENDGLRRDLAACNKSQ
jgi:energy-coupling factor transporter transmembrane protein EcfT